MKKVTVKWIYEMRLERIRKLPRYQVRKPKHKKAQP